MAGATYVLDKTYKCKTAGGIGRFRAVTKGSNDGEVLLPSAANAVCMGITQEAVTATDRNISVRKYGITRAVAGGTIAAGDWLEIADNTGALRTATLTAGAYTVHNIVGQAEAAAVSGDIFPVFLTPGPCVQAAS
jgi:hypothetical protein